VGSLSSHQSVSVGQTRHRGRGSGWKALLEHRERANSSCCRANAVGVGGNQAEQSEVTGLSLRVRRASVSDAASVSSLCGEVFSTDTTDGMKEAAPWLAPWLDFIQEWYSSSISKELGFQLKKALEGKLQCTRESQTLRLRYKFAEEQSKKTGVVQNFNATQAARNLKRVIASKDNQRMFCCLLAENEEGETVASVTVSMTIPDAKLPPPFPSRGIQRFYIGNMVVREDYRRKGIATFMLDKCETLAKRWNCDSIWLHVGVDSPGAQKLYKNLGYFEKSKDPWYMILEKRYLYCKPLELPKNGKFQRLDKKSPPKMVGF